MTSIVKYGAYQFVQSETAQKLKNSAGSEKSRLHLLNYEGLEGKDRYAVAAEIITFKDGEEKKLGLRDRQFNVLHEHDNGDGTSIWYKINKNSLEKRLGISSAALKEDNGVIGNKLEELVKAKQKNLDELVSLANPQNDFERRLVRGLAEAGITKAFFGEIFYDRDGKNPEISDDDVRKASKQPLCSALIITYATQEDLLVNIRPNLQSVIDQEKSPVVKWIIDHSAYKKINAGECIPQKVLDQLNQPLDLPKGYVTWGDERVEFDSKTGLLDILKIFREFKADGTDGDIIYNGVDGKAKRDLSIHLRRGKFLEEFLSLVK